MRMPSLISSLFPQCRPLALVSSLLLTGCGGDAPSSAGMDEAAPRGSGWATLSTDRYFDAASSTYQDLQGRGLEIASFEGQRVFVNFWATWCAPCIRELPALARAAEELADENHVFLFASDESVETITAFLDERGFEGNFIKLNTYFGAYGVDAVPSSILYDEEGNLIRHWPGAHEWDSEEMLAQIRNPGLTSTE